MKRTIPRAGLAMVLAFSTLSTVATPRGPQEVPEPAYVRMVDLDGDGRLDRLQIGPLGSFRVALNRGGRHFEPVAQAVASERALPPIAHVLVGDLDGDGLTDLYLVSPGANVALVGDGAGRFREATEVLGLADEGRGCSAERVDVDADGLDDLLLHDEGGDVLFWANPAGVFERDGATPPNVNAAAVPQGLLPGGSVAPPHGSDPASGLPDSTVGRRTERARLDGAPASGTSRAGAEAFAGSTPGGGAQPLVFTPSCIPTIEDATTGNCLTADSTPHLGSLYPLSTSFNLDPGGNIGIGTTSQAARVHVEGGSVRVDDGDVAVFDGATRTIALDAADGASGNGGQILLGNGSGTETMQLDANAAGSGNALIGIRNSAGISGMSLSANGTGGAGELRVNDALGGLTALLQGERAMAPGGSQLSLLDGGVSAVEVRARHPNAMGARGQILLRDDSDAPTAELDAGAGNRGGVLKLSTEPDKLHNPVSTIELSAGQPYDANASYEAPAFVMRDPEFGNDDVRLCVSADGGSSGPSLVMNFGSVPRFEIQTDLATGPQVGGLWSRYANGNDAVFVGIEEGTGGNPFSREVFYEEDGSKAMEFFEDDLTLYDSSGAATVNFDRQSGTKSAVLSTPTYGQRLFYALESSEVWLEDAGRGRLVDGEARIRLDPIFLEAVTIDDRYPMEVFVTPHGSSRGVWVQRGTDHFVVRENGDGASSVAFDWRVIAKRQGVESLRMEPFND